MKSSLEYVWPKHPLLRAIPPIVVILTVLLLFSTYRMPTTSMTLPEFLLEHTCPSPRTISTSFAEHHEYQDMSSDADGHWDALLTPNGGFLIQESEDGKRHLYGISMFHQLHCLQLIRAKVQDLWPNRTSEERVGHGRGHRTHHHHGVAEDHFMHCLDYLRQVGKQTGRQLSR